MLEPCGTTTRPASASSSSSCTWTPHRVRCSRQAVAAARRRGGRHQRLAAAPPWPPPLGGPTRSGLSSAPGPTRTSSRRPASCTRSGVEQHLERSVEIDEKTATYSCTQVSCPVSVCAPLLLGAPSLLSFPSSSPKSRVAFLTTPPLLLPRSIAAVVLPPLPPPPPPLSGLPS